MNDIKWTTLLKEERQRWEMKRLCEMRKGAFTDLEFREQMIVMAEIDEKIHKINQKLNSIYARLHGTEAEDETVWRF